MKTLLRERHKQALYDLIRKVVTCPKEDAAILEAYAKAAPLVRKAVESEYPSKDMKVLKRYEMARQDDCIKLRLTTGEDVMFDFEKGTGPLAVKMTYQGKMFLADEPTTNAVLDWATAVKVRADVYEQKRKDYLALVNSARTLDEVTQVWEEANAIRPMFEQNCAAISILTPKVIERIKADVKERQQSVS